MIATFPKVISSRSGGLGDPIISSLSRCGRSFANIEGRNTALAGQPELALGWMSGPGLVPVGDRRSHRHHANLPPPPEHYYGADRPDGYHCYSYYQPYRPHQYSRPQRGAVFTIGELFFCGCVLTSRMARSPTTLLARSTDRRREP